MKESTTRSAATAGTCGVITYTVHTSLLCLTHFRSWQSHASSSQKDGLVHSKLNCFVTRKYSSATLKTIVLFLFLFRSNLRITVFTRISQLLRSKLTMWAKLSSITQNGTSSASITMRIMSLMSQKEGKNLHVRRVLILATLLLRTTLR